MTQEDQDFVAFVLLKRPPHVPPSYPERERLWAIFDGLTGVDVVLSGLNRLRTKVPPEIAQRILTLQTDLIKWEKETGAGQPK